MMNSSYLLNKSWLIQLVLLFLVLSTRALLLAGGSTLWIRLSSWAKARQIVPGEIARKELILEALHGIKILFLDAAFAVLLIKVGIFHFSKLENAAQFVFTFLLMFVWVEIYFYYSHRLFHHPKLFWLHRHHHQATLINPWTSLSFSIWERFTLLSGVALVPALLSFWFPFPVEAFAAYFFVNYALNVYGHLNVEIVPNIFVHSWLGKIINTTTYHSLHHIRYRGHYGLFTSLPDRFHGTKYQDYESVQEKNFSKGAATRSLCSLRLPS